MAYRVLLAQFMHETNTFSPMPTDMALFKETFFAEAGKHPDEPGFMTGPTFAARKLAKRSNIEVIEGLHALALTLRSPAEVAAMRETRG